MANRTELKARFSSGQRIGESDFALLIDSLAHLSEDVSSGSLATGSSVSSIQEAMDALTELANQTKSDLDSYMGTHPTLAEVQAADSALSDTLSANLTSQSQLSASVDAALQASIDNLSSRFTDIDNELTQKWNDTDATIQGLPSTYATITDLNTRETNLESLIQNKADEVHQHEEYATKDSLANYITLEDVPEYAPIDHGHSASQISGLDDLFMTPAETQALIDANKVEIDLEAALYDNFYEKDETDLKFYVARWRTDQVSLFNPTVVEVAQPYINSAKTEALAASNLVQDNLDAEVTNRGLALDSLRTDLKVSIGTVASDLTQAKTNLELADTTLQGNITTVANNASASIASSQSHVLSELSSIRAELISDISDNTTAISEAETSANSYTDTKVSELIGGAGAAFDTLNELQQALTSGDNDLATEISTQVSNLGVSIATNRTAIGLVEERATTLESDVTTMQTDITNLQTADTNIEGSITTLQSSYDTLLSSNTTLTSAYNELLSRVNTLENTAYAEAGYVFP